jgi:predicted double-glycine peptidase
MPIRYWRIPQGAIRVPVPDTTQDEDATCGASSLLSICLYYGVGPVEEREVVKAMGMDVRRGSNPEHIVRAAKRYGLQVRQKQPMSVRRLLYWVGKKKPVIVMLQAWGDRSSYKDDWEDGHWVVAIGWDDQGIYFEDPVMSEARGYLTYEEMDDRWHDVGRYGKHVPQYGAALWKDGVKPCAKDVKRARRIN